MAIHVKEIHDVIILRLSEESDLTGSSEFDDTVKKYVDERGRKKLVIDLSGFHLVNSYGIGLIVKLSLKLDKYRGNLAIINNDPMVTNLFTLAEIDKIVTICHNEQQALDYLNKI